MKIKNKWLLIAAAVAVFSLSQTGTVKAGPSDRDLPDENDIFWQVTGSMNRPDDTAACQAKIDQMAADGTLEAYITAHRDELMSEGPSQGGEWQGDGPTTTEMAQGFYQMCAGLAQMPTEMQASMTSEGVSTNLFDATDWHNIAGLYFQKAGKGRIAFTVNTLDFLSYRFMRFMSNFDSMVNMDDGYISLNSAVVTDFKNYGAQLTMLDLNFTQQPDIYVDGKLAGSTDVADISYNPGDGTLTFGVSHFSSYRAVAKGSKVKAMRITNLTKKSKSIKYDARKSTFRVVARGKNFVKSSNAACLLGFESASKVTVTKKKVTCVFPMSYFSDLGTYNLTISIPGSGEVTKTSAVRIK